MNRPRRDLVFAVVLACVVTALDVWLLDLPIRRYLIVKPTIAASAPMIAFVLARRAVAALAILLAQAAFFWASFASPRLVKVAALAAFTAVAFVQYGFVAGAGGVVNVHDVTMALQNVNHWTGMAEASLDWRALAPTALFAAALAWCRLEGARWGRRWLVAATLTLSVHAAISGSFVLKRTVYATDDASVPAPMSAFEALFRTASLFAYSEAADAIRPPLRQTIQYRAAAVPTRHVVLVIDESMSALHLSVNGYGRPTTPWLEALQREGRLTNWGPVAAASTYSDASICALMTGLNALPDPQRRVLTLPTIFQYAKAMNYRTHLLDSELAGLRFGLTWPDMRYVDDWRSAKTFGDDPDSDVRLGRAAAEILKQRDGQFVLILKRGNHAPPEDNYPAGAGPWRPSRDGDVPSGEERAAAINAYDNAVRYNLDPFFRTLLSADGGLPHAVGLYTSDHAEALGADGPLFHRLVSYEVVSVPLLMFGDDRPPVDTAYAAGHHNIFATLLDLMGVPASARAWPYGRSLLGAKAGDHDARPVLAGYLFGKDFYSHLADYDEVKRGKTEENYLVPGSAQTPEPRAAQ